jgi:hypothetical protein
MDVVGHLILAFAVAKSPASAVLGIEEGSKVVLGKESLLQPARCKRKKRFSSHLSAHTPSHSRALQRR